MTSPWARHENDLLCDLALYGQIHPADPEWVKAYEHPYTNGTVLKEVWVSLIVEANPLRIEYAMYDILVGVVHEDEFETPGTVI